MSKSVLSTADSNFQLQKMRYNNNSLSYKLGLGGIVFSVLACFIGLNSVEPSVGRTIFIILLNIAIMLFGFLSAEKVKTYTKKYTYYMYALGGLCVLRIFFYPLILLVNYPKFIAIINSYPAEQIEAAHDEAIAKYGDKLGDTICGKIVDGKLVGTGYLWNNGTFRGTLLVVLLVLAAVCFISSGVVNYYKEKKLSAYLLSINEKR